MQGFLNESEKPHKEYFHETKQSKYLKTSHRKQPCRTLYMSQNIWYCFVHSPTSFFKGLHNLASLEYTNHKYSYQTLA